MILEALLYDRSREACGESGRKPSFDSWPLGLGGWVFDIMALVPVVGGWVLLKTSRRAFDLVRT